MFPRHASRIRLVPVLAGLLLLGAAADGKGCKGCKGRPDEEPVIDEVVEVIPAKVETELQVVSIDPAAVGAGERFLAKIYGSGFEPQASVRVGSVAGENVKVGATGTSIQVEIPPLTDGYHDVTVENFDGESAVLRRGLYVAEGIGECSFLRVFFDFDKASLAPDSEAAIGRFTPCYLKSVGTIEIEGHADERGTIDYNIALGERRAESVSRYLTGKGVSPSRIDTISYGEERPWVAGHTEDAWSQNRRVEIHAP